MPRKAPEKVHVFADEDHIIHDEEQRVVTPESVAEEEKAFIKMFETKFVPFGIKPRAQLTDLRGVSLKSIYTCRHLISALGERLRTKYMDMKHPFKMAVLTSNRFLYISASFILTAGGLKNKTRMVKFFDSEAKAMAWLKEKD